MDQKETTSPQTDEMNPASKKGYRKFLGGNPKLFNRNMYIFAAIFAVIVGYFIFRAFAYSPTTITLPFTDPGNGNTYTAACIDPNYPGDQGSSEFIHIGSCSQAEKADGFTNSSSFVWCADLDGSQVPKANNWISDGSCPPPGQPPGTVTVTVSASPNIITTDKPMSLIQWNVSGSFNYCEKVMATNSPNNDPFWTGHVGAVGSVNETYSQLGLYIFGIRCFDSSGNNIGHSSTTVQLNQGTGGGGQCTTTPTVYGDQGTHHVPAPQPTSNSAKIYGIVNENAPPNDTSCQTFYYFDWGTNSTPNNQSPDSPSPVSDLPMDNQNHTVNVTLTNLAPNTKYYYYPCATYTVVTQGQPQQQSICSSIQTVTTSAPGSGGGTPVTYSQGACTNPTGSHLFKYNGTCSDNDILNGMVPLNPFTWCAAASNPNQWINDGACPADTTPDLTGTDANLTDADIPGDDNPDAPGGLCSAPGKQHYQILLASTCGKQKKWVKAIYLLPSDYKALGANRNYNSNGRIATSLQALNGWLAAQANGKYLRLATDPKTGKIDVPREVLPYTQDQMLRMDYGTNQKNITDFIKSKGFTNPNYIYIIYYEGASGYEVVTDPNTGQQRTIAGVACGISNVPGQYAIAYLWQFVTSSVLQRGYTEIEGCPGGLTKSASQVHLMDLVAMHELMHSFGYVQVPNPNPNKCVPDTSNSNPNPALGDHVTDGAKIDLLWVYGLSQDNPNRVVLDFNHKNYFLLPKGSPCPDFNKDPVLAVKPKG